MKINLTHVYLKLRKIEYAKRVFYLTGLQPIILFDLQHWNQLTGGRIQLDSSEVKSYKGLEIWMDLWHRRTMGNNSHRTNDLLSFLYYARIDILIISNT